MGLHVCPPWDEGAFVNFMHLLGGIFLWDFLTTMGFEWDFIIGKRKYRWTILLYSIGRIGAVGNATSNLVGFEVTHQINCAQWTIWTLILAYISFACASALIALRVIDIWIHNSMITRLTIGMWLTNAGFLFYGGIAAVRSTWSTASGGYALESTFQSWDNITVIVVTGFAQLIIMLVGLLRCRQRSHGMFRNLSVQGFIWSATATLGELLSVVFINLNLNSNPWNLMFQNIALYTTQICVARMYRALANHNTDVYGNPSYIITRDHTLNRIPVDTRIPRVRMLLVNRSSGCQPEWRLPAAQLTQRLAAIPPLEVQRIGNKAWLRK
ncbi:hypothetical protein BJV78DRAFT_686538 [Lactifluus subvellereus]|nr:hypothetical protein BJV78DRAFT_686538 [Lactifluus subvellereus]